jgi:hypothetical protein
VTRGFGDVASSFIKKGALILAFAAACGGMAGCDRKPAAAPAAPQATTQTADTVKVEPTAEELQAKAEREARRMGRDAADYQIRTEELKKELAAGNITQQDFDKGVKEDDDMIAARRQFYIGKPNLQDFDAAFAEDVTKAGYQVPANLAGGAATQSTTAPAPEPEKQPKSQEILKALAPVIDAMLNDNSKIIGPEASEAALGGQTAREQIFPGGPVQNSTRISASALKSGEKYFFNGKLTIDGNLPPNVTLNIRDGKLVLNGNAGAGDVINVTQPTVVVGATTVTGGTHPEKYPCWNNAPGPSQDKPSDYSYHYGYRQDGCTKDVPNAPTTTGGHEELKYKDADPAVRITGVVAPDARIKTNGGKVATGAPATTTTKPAATQPLTP